MPTLYHKLRQSAIILTDYTENIRACFRQWYNKFMSDFTPSYRIQRGRPQQTGSNHHRIILGMVTLSLIFVGLWWLITQLKQDKVASEFYFVDSKYQGIKSQFDNKKSAKFLSIIEYPLTNSPIIDQQIKKQLDILTGDFFEQTKLLTNLPEPATQNISYQVYLNNEHFLSLAIFIHQDIRGAHPGAHTLFWTFDKKTGQPVTISQLFDNQRPAIDNFLNTIKTAVRQQIKDDHLDDEYFKQSLGNGDKLTFIVKDRHTIEFLFGRGTVGPQSAGEITVNVKVNTFKTDLQNQLAKSLFDIQAIEPPTPTPPKPDEKLVALTYDDGPGDHTNRLLDILRDNKVLATFFVVGRQVPTRADLVKRIVKEKHEIGNHTWDHPDLTKMTASQIEQQLLNTINAIKTAEPKAQIRAVRPPYGAFNQEILNILNKHGLSNVLWSVDTRDWADRDANIVCNRAVTSAQPGAIILLHDIHGSSVDATPCIIDGLKKAGYKFTTVSNLFGGDLKAGATYFQN